MQAPFERVWQTVGTLTLGSLIGQLVSSLGFLALSRLYSPAELGQLGILLSVSAIAAIVLTGRMETFILLAKNDEELPSLVRYATRRVLNRILPLLLAGCGLALLDGSRALLWLAMPASSYLWSIEQIRFLYAMRLGHYRSAAAVSVSRPVVQVLVPLVPWMFIPSAIWLFLGAILARIASLALLPKPSVVACEISSITRLEIGRFTMLQVPIAAVSVFSQSIPTVLVAALLGDTSAGIYSLAYRFLAAPSMALGNAVRSVYSRQLATGRDVDQWRHTIKLARYTFPAGALVAIGGWFLADILLTRVLGSEWTLAGDVAAALSLLVGFRLAFSPLAQVLIASKFQGRLLGWHILNLCVIGATWMVADLFGMKLVSAVTLYSLCVSLSYCILGLLIWRSLKAKQRIVA